MKQCSDKCLHTAYPGQRTYKREEDGEDGGWGSRFLQYCDEL
jgi:hypothetical protein